MQGCLDERTILDVAEGSLEASRQAGVADHLDTCELCRQLVALAAREDRGDEPDDAAPPPTLPSRQWLSQGQTVGRYTILKFLGAGGMGAVYAAYDPQLDRKVALKLLRPGGGAASARERLATLLQREGQALARVSHPNVVAVYDAGTFEDQVFVAMEFVEGENLRAWLAVKPRPWREVLRVLSEAGAGLCAAHEVGLVHRDFKPDNVLLASSGRVYVTDFGLARETQAVPAESAPPSTGESSGESGPAQLSAQLSRVGAVAGTPAYMAPEQMGGEVDARADQFAFAVTLFEAIFGKLPFERSAHLLAEGPPAAQPLDLPARPRLPRWLQRALKRATAFAPGDRFSSMHALLTVLDLRRRRRRRTLTAAALAVALGFAALLATRVQPELCRGGGRKLARVWDEERKQGIAARFRASALPFAQDAWRGTERALDAYAQSWRAAHAEACEATVRYGEQSAQVLELRTQCLQRRLRGLQALTELFLQADGNAIRSAVDASYHLEPVRLCADVEALRAHRAGLPSEPLARAGVARLEGELAQARALSLAGAERQAVNLIGAVVAGTRQLGAPSLEAEGLLAEGRMRLQLGEHDRAEESYRAAYRLAAAWRRDDLVLQSFLGLAFLDGERRRNLERGRLWLDLAEPVGARSTSARGLNSALVSTRGILAFRAGALEQAVALHRAALTADEAENGSQHPTVATGLLNLFQALNALGRFDEAKEALRRSYELSEALYGPSHPLVATRLLSLGTFHLLREEVNEALPCLERTLAIRERTLPAQHPGLASALNALGGTLVDAGELQRARGLIVRAKALEASRGEPSAETLGNEALLLLGEEQTEDASRVVARALAAPRATREPHLRVQLLFILAKVELARGRPAQALRAADEVLTLGARALGQTHLFLAYARRERAAALRALGRRPEAEVELREVLRSSEQLLGADHVVVGKALTELGALELERSGAATALPHLERAVRILAGPGRAAAAHAALLLAQALVAAGHDRTRPRKLLQQALRALEPLGSLPRANRLGQELRVLQARLK